VRVLHVTPYFAPAFRYGGPPRSILGLCRALVDAGVDVEVFTTTANGDRPLPAAPQGMYYDNVRVRYFPLAWPQRYWRARGLRAALRTAAVNADVVHVHGLWNVTSWSGAACARAARRPYVISPRGMLQPEAMRRNRELKTLAYWGIERTNLQSAALLHATSEAERRELARCGPPVCVVPNGVTSVCAKPDAIGALRKAAGVCENDTVVACLGRLHPIKRLDLLADAFAIVHRTHPSAKLLIAGPDEGGYRSRVEPLFAPVSTATRWVGPLDSEQVAALFAISRVLVQCSDSESFGMSIAEGLTSGVPVVATKGSAWTDLHAIECGYSVAHDAAAIADGIARVLDATDAAMMRRRASDWARQTFAWDSVASAMRDAYELALSGPYTGANSR
jgi:glycosyltransferase involved in cell wall biosynthesis